MTSAELLAAEFAITIGNPDVWLSIGRALLLGAGCWVFGTWVARAVGLLRPDAPAGETLGVGLACGLMVVAAWWAAIWSGGRSSFTPVAVGFAIALALAVAHRARRPAAADAPTSEAADRGDDGTTAPPPPHRRSLILSALAGAVFVIAVALLYGSTMAPSPRDGVQPVEFMDHAFYSVLGRDLATTGTETNIPPSGFSDLPGVPPQTWYHWAELWLASAVITVFGTAPVAARSFIVLPVVLLAAAALMGTLVRRMVRTSSRPAYLFGFTACLFLAPMPFLPGPYFSASNVGLIFGITTYGLAVAAVFLALYIVAVIGRRKATWALAGFAGSTVAFILPSHIAFGALVLGGVGIISTIRLIRSVRSTRRLPVVSPPWRRILVVAGAVVAATVVWGMLTGHSMGRGAPPIVSAFNESWRSAVAITILGGGVFFAIAVAWFLARKEAGFHADLYVGTVVVVLAGAMAWGARLGEFTMFHAFYGGIAVIATPVAAVAVRTVWERLRATHHRILAAGLLALCVIQLGFGVVNGILRMQALGPHSYDPTSVSMLRAIGQLPSDAKLAYACGPFEEVGFATPRLLSIDAHTGRRVVPMCFAAEVLSTVIGASPSAQVPSLYFHGAPQMTLFPDVAANPSSVAVASFLKDNGIDYIYSDARHPNSLVDEAIPIAKDGDAEVLRVP